MARSQLPPEPSEVLRVSRRRLTACRETLREHGADVDALTDRELTDYILQSWVYWSRHRDNTARPCVAEQRDYLHQRYGVHHKEAAT